MWLRGDRSVISRLGGSGYALMTNPGVFGRLINCPGVSTQCRSCAPLWLQSVVTLRRQYRMAADIQMLPNEVWNQRGVMRVQDKKLNRRHCGGHASILRPHPPPIPNAHSPPACLHVIYIACIHATIVPCVCPPPAPRQCPPLPLLHPPYLQLIYSGALVCGSEQVAQGMLHLPSKAPLGEPELTSWLVQVRGEQILEKLVEPLPLCITIVFAQPAHERLALEKQADTQARRSPGGGGFMHALAHAPPMRDNV